MKNILLLAAVLGVLNLIAGEDLKINGDFKGASGRNIPGWKLENGNFRIVPGEDSDEFAAELDAETELISSRYPVSGDILEISAKVRGSGLGRISYIVFDSKGNPLTHYADGIRFSAQSRKSKVRAQLTIPREAVQLAVVLTAAKNSRIVFEDIEAEFESPRPVSALENSKTPLIDERYYRMKELDANGYSVSIAPGKDVEFKLEESDTAKWRVKSADSRLFRISIEHDREGFWPLYRYDAEVEIKALRRGNGEITLQHASGREMKISVSVK